MAGDDAITSLADEPIVSSEMMPSMLNTSENESMVVPGDDYYDYEVHYISDMPEATAVPIVFGIFFIIGLIGNGTVILIVALNKNMRNVPNIYITNLALGDFLLIAFSVPFSSVLYTFTGWHFGEAVCKLNVFVQSLSLGVSVFTLTALSTDRFIAIVYPMAKHTGNPMLRTIVFAVFIWMASIILAIPDAVTSFVIEAPYSPPNATQPMMLCRFYPEALGEAYPKAHTMVRFIVYFVVPMLIITPMYVIMAVILMTSMTSTRTAGQSSSVSNQHVRQTKERFKVAMLVLSFIGIFFFCWLPRHIYLIWFHFDESEYNMAWHTFKIIGFCLMFMNSCVNPLALYLLSKQFRHFYHRYLLCCLPKEVIPTSSSMSGYSRGDHNTQTHSMSHYSFNGARRGSGNTVTSAANPNTNYQSHQSKC
ncbi:unnamed protein product [Owenia fusiformis]|nr:unnamed protein product [Owenia fusiformis]